MITILSLLALLAGAAAVIAIGTRISLYFYTHEQFKAHPFIAGKLQATSPEAPTTLERSAIVLQPDTMRASSRYAWIGLTVITVLVLLAILMIVSIISGSAL
jgi:hypothetical protein